MQAIEAVGAARKQMLVEELRLSQQKLQLIQQERQVMEGKAGAFIGMGTLGQRQAIAAAEKMQRGESLTVQESQRLMQVGNEEQRAYARREQVRIAEQQGGGQFVSLQQYDETIAKEKEARVIVAKAEADIKVDLADGIESKFEQINRETEEAVMRIVERMIQNIEQINPGEIENAVAENMARGQSGFDKRSGFGP